MDVFRLRNHLIRDYATYASSFINISDERIHDYVDESFREGIFWPDALIQLNPNFERGRSVDDLVRAGVLHPECSRIFRKDKQEGDMGEPMRLYRHQEDAILAADAGQNYVLTTGTGSGKSLAYIIPIVDFALKHGQGRHIKAIIVYPMNALANSQYGELEKFLVHGYPAGRSPVTFAQYTGQEDDIMRQAIISHPPDILLTNYVMLELILTRPREHKLINAAQGLQFLVLDELHTYRGRQGADVALLVRRVRERLAADSMQTIGTSATLASEGPYHEQQHQIAAVAGYLFGAPVAPENVIGETLERATPEPQLTNSDYIKRLREQVARGAGVQPPTTYETFVEAPLSGWIETVFGIRWDDLSGRYVRSRPIGVSGLHGAAMQLHELTELPVDICEAAIERWLLAGYRCMPHPETEQPPFAFRFHQFISPGDTVYASLEDEASRYITVYGQRYVPESDREKVLFPLVFCRECGQEYYSVYRSIDEVTEEMVFTPRDYRAPEDDEQGEASFLYLSSERPWPEDPDEYIALLPDQWLEDHRGDVRVKHGRRQYLPESLSVGADGRRRVGGTNVALLPTPFMFCLNCGVSYTPRQSDFGKLASLSSEGRSSATTILSLSAIKGLREETSLEQEAQKLLSFSDNRQDASLQAGHFNDFVEVGMLRSALFRALVEAGEEGLRYDVLSHRIFEALNLPLEHYARDPQVRYQALEETHRALRDVLGYRLYVDLRRGWRITSPNLEQTGLLKIDYLSLETLCRTEEDWQGIHPTLVMASPDTRARVARTLLDYMRRELAIHVEYLDTQHQEQIQSRSYNRLSYPWAIDEEERMEYATVLLPHSRRPHDARENVYLSSRGGFGIYLRRRPTFPDYHDNLDLAATDQIIRDLLETLRIAGLVERVAEPEDEEDVPGYQIPAAAMIWRAGDGTMAFHDPIRMPTQPEEGGRTNSFFVDFYRTAGEELQHLEAREHTAQVRYEHRQEREERFRNGELPVLYCSPTMELGVDIAELNVVNMRNVPPTPANYAQRSGRAGRGGQPALVFTYCSSGSPHDQYFFRRPDQMVAGEVTPPRVELGNEALVTAHVQAIWLAKTGLDLGQTLVDVLDVSGDEPSLELQEHIVDQINRPDVYERTYGHALTVLQTFSEELGEAGWYDEDWLDRTLRNAPQAFDRACDRWRDLYRAARTQAEEQGRIRLDASRSAQDKRRAVRLRAEAESQLRLLTEAEYLAYSDFYSYRYFATEGFLPGYSFPRLPISAYIPARRRAENDEFISRPRFLAISEFGPRSIIYHEGSRYLINQVILPVDRDESFDHQVKRCEICGYVNDMENDRCENCNSLLNVPLTGMFRMQNVVTRRRDRINSDEEERLRLGYDIQTGLSYDESQVRHTTVRTQDEVFATMKYVQSATLWRINLGWSRRKNKNQHGFVLDVERGYWERNDQLVDDPEDPMSERTRRVIPYVRDTRNCLLFEPTAHLSVEQMASLQSALKRAIETVYQLEDRELESEPLPGKDDRRLLLFYEATEGGAGVLRRLQSDPEAMARVARAALQICHFDPETGADIEYAPQADERCEAACYDCLLSYGNQREHGLLDRHLIRDVLWQLKEAAVEPSPTALPAIEHLAHLKRLCDSDLEREWLDFLFENGYSPPDAAQALIETCETRVDFIYEDRYAVIFVDGPHHDYAEQSTLDQTQMACLQDAGFEVIRFGYQDDWNAIIDAHHYIFEE